MTPTSTAGASSNSRPTRSSSRTAKASSTKPAKTMNGSKKTEAASASKSTSKSATASSKLGKGTKRQAPPSKTNSRKRVKQEDSDDDQEGTSEDNNENQEDQEEYKDEVKDESEDQESEDDDFQDDSYSSRRNKKDTKLSSSATKMKLLTSSTSTNAAAIKKKPLSKSKNTDLLPAPSKTFLVSPLKIPHPKKGPFADAIQPETLEFIRDLKLNNDREYMLLNQERCNQAKSDFLDFIRMVKEGLLEADRDVMDQEPKDAMMRIYRDIRFSNDKSPYKRQFACRFSRGGRKSIAAGYFFGVTSDGESYAGCGVFDPSGPVLTRIRHGIVDHQDRFKAILETDGIKAITGGRTGLDAFRPGSSQLKTGPVGFDKNHPMIEFLKRKSFAIGRHFTDEEVVNEGFLESVLETFDACVDLVHIFNEWIG
ncbi:hypothetical protein BG011_009689 [Mortierella polycephala]|uniref:TIGR02453 family protein n=1 Tax=Mortierella polycephala TaxID=41804 RepID=A0A9P6PNP6_9FUNG|nr:hypothetical protein BG011_009689 [Mortierella polycephala]